MSPAFNISAVISSFPGAFPLSNALIAPRTSLIKTSGNISNDVIFFKDGTHPEICFTVSDILCCCTSHYAVCFSFNKGGELALHFSTDGQFWWFVAMMIVAIPSIYYSILNGEVEGSLLV
ncbi:hypothetical protein Y032_0089g2221 [Ancylostoma ceylanicum]|uniref:Uncharacterized protein n=1 Tax=Ancylostoma ceylanicum TaxID=53326 RepID=A0A016TMC4_9BILA|nr:hypothetical protein Y032_0089g2221 [Ancylostoma ceylanicum]